MTRTEYQQHLLDEYASYLRKAIANKTENYTFTPQQLAASLLKAFEKGVMRGILYESQNDIEKEGARTVKPEPKPETRKEQLQKEAMSEDDAKAMDAAMKELADLFIKALIRH